MGRGDDFTVAKHGGKYLVRGGKMEMLEGTGSLPSSFVILEFPTMNDARAFYGDPDYAPFIKLRQAGEITNRKAWIL